MARLPESDAKWAEVSALAAEVEARQDAELERNWELASERVREAYELIRGEVERLAPRLRRDLEISYRSRDAVGPADRLSSLVADSRDTYLATREVADGTASDIYRYAAGDVDALRRAERLAAGRRTERVTPGYHWWIDRAGDTGRRETVMVRLTVNIRGVAQLRSGDRVTPVTAKHWAELTEGALPPRPAPATKVASPSHQRPPWPKRLMVALFPLVFSFDFWFVVLFLALVVSLGVIVVLALLRL